MSANSAVNVRPDPDRELVEIADYVKNYEIDSVEARETARNCLMDTLGAGFSLRRSLSV